MTKHSKLFGSFLQNILPSQQYSKQSCLEIDTKIFEIDLSLNYHDFNKKMLGQLNIFYLYLVTGAIAKVAQEKSNADINKQFADMKSLVRY